MDYWKKNELDNDKYCVVSLICGILKNVKVIGTDGGCQGWELG